MKSENKTIKIGLAEDHHLLRQGMLTMLSTEDNLAVVFDVSNGAELMEALNIHTVDVILLDIEMPILNGIEVLKILSTKFPDIKVLILSSHYENDMIYQALTNGARGFLPKHAEIETVIDAIFTVMEEGYFFDDKVSPSLINTLSKNGIMYPPYENELLSERELEVVKLICLGKSNKEISKELFISVRTVENHRGNIFSKTNTKNSAGLIVYAIKNGYFKITI